MCERACPTCGRVLEAPTEARRGRPRIYCSERCAEIESLRSRLERLTSEMVADLRAEGASVTPELAALRGGLWRIANLLNALGRPTTGRNASDRTRSGWRGLRKG